MMPNEDIVIEGDFKLSDDTKYVIEYYVQNINNDEFSVLDLETLKGTTFTDLNYVDEAVEDNEENTDNKKYYKVKEFDGLTKFCQCCYNPMKDQIHVTDFNFCDSTDEFAEFGIGISLYFFYYRFLSCSGIDINYFNCGFTII